MNISSELYCEHTRRLVLRRQNVYGSVNSKLTSNGIELEVIENLRCGHSLTEDQDQAFVMTSVFILIFQCTLVFMARLLLLLCFAFTPQCLTAAMLALQLLVL